MLTIHRMNRHCDFQGVMNSVMYRVRAHLKQSIGQAERRRIQRELARTDPATLRDIGVENARTTVFSIAA